jgi:argininosuccinate lyase
MERCQQRITALRGVNKQNPLGSGAIAGSGLPLDRSITAGLLPVGPATPNSIDGTASRDAALDMVYSLAMISQTLSRLAEQWIIYMSDEFGFLKIGEAYTTGSSMMPQKRNPDMLELIRGRCGNVYGNLVAMLTMVKGTPIAYNRDLQEDKRHLFAAFDMVCDCLEMATRIVKSAKFQEQRINERLHRGFLDATALADYLVTRNVPFRTAHQVVGALVRECEAQNLEQLSDLKLEDFNKACINSGQKPDTCDAEVYAWLGPANVVKRYQSYGNSGLSGFTQQIKAWEKRLKKS